MLELSHVTVRYGEKTVLRDVSAAFPPGEVLVIVGPNGSGKSTLLKTALGLQKHVGGEITIDGIALEAMTPKRIARRLAYLPQQRNAPGITAWRMVMHGRFPHMEFPRRTGLEDRRIVARALRDADAEELAGRSMKELSGGQRQKVYIAMALAQQSDTILMDEPTTWLDVSHQHQVVRLAKKLAAQGKSIVLVLHDLPLAFQAADRLLVLHEGRISCSGTPEEIYERGVVPDVFGVSLSKVKTEAGWHYFCEAMEG